MQAAELKVDKLKQHVIHVKFVDKVFEIQIRECLNQEKHSMDVLANRDFVTKHFAYFICYILFGYAGCY